MTYLDTHVVAWLYAGMVQRFPERAQEALENEDLAVSPMVVVELEYLFEIDRMTAPATEILEHLGELIALRVCDASFHRVMLESLGQSWTRDPFDRVIVGHARSQGAALLTKDNTIRASYPPAFWD